MANVAFYNGVAGMQSFQQLLDVTGNNLANVNTNGYKKQRASFEDLLYTRINQHENYQQETAEGQLAGGENIDLRGHGTRIAYTQMMYKSGGYIGTDTPFDFAIEGDGLFATEKNGQREYTRSGAFSLSQDGKDFYLITSDNARVLDNRGKEIKIEMDENGLPVFDGLADKIGVYHFSNPYGLVNVGNTRLVETAVSGAGVAQRGTQADSKIHQFMLENSNVDMADEMVNMMEAQRAFQMNARMVQTADQIDETVNNLR